MVDCGWGVLDYGTDLEDFMDTAALVSCLDLVITVDTAVAHLAGALGKPCWTMLPQHWCDWRWGKQGEGTHWYPTMRLFRQEEGGGWQPVLNRVREALLQWCKETN